MKRANILFILLLSLPVIALAQPKEITLETAIDLALKNNAGLRASSTQVEHARKMVGTAFDIDKTEVYYHYDENNIAENGLPIGVWGISQSLQFPTVYGAQRNANKAQVFLKEQEFQINEQLLRKEVSKAYNTLVYWQNVAANYHYLDSLYKQFSIAASRRYEVGETNYLEKLTATSKQKEVGLMLLQIKENITKGHLELNKWMQLDSAFVVTESNLDKLEPTSIDTLRHPGLLYYQGAVSLSESKVSIEKQKLLPDINLNYFQGTNNGMDSKVYQGFQAGIGIPLFFGAQKSKINAAKLETEAVQSEALNYKQELITRYRQLETELTKYEEAINYYVQNGKTLSSELIHTATKAFQNGEIDFVQYILSLDNAKSIEMTYLENLYNYNQTVLEINYLMN